MSRPQISIDRLMPRRATVEPREAMNCKSCRKRKVGSPQSDHRIPAELSRSNATVCAPVAKPARSSNVPASTVSSVPVICRSHRLMVSADAVPKKRGPKTDVLEALLKRVDGLEKRLQDEKNPISPTSPDSNPEDLPLSSQSARRNTIDAATYNQYTLSDSRPALSTPSLQKTETYTRPTGHGSSSALSQPSPKQNGILSDMLLNAYFARLHGKPFFVLDEQSTRHRHQFNQLPAHLSMAISAMTLRYIVGRESPMKRIANSRQIYLLGRPAGSRLAHGPRCCFASAADG